MRLSRKLRKKLFYNVPVAGKQIGHSRAGSYRAAQRGEIPTERHGRFLLVPRSKWDRMKGKILRGENADA